MRTEPITIDKFREILLVEQEGNDLARIVNPYSCSTLSIDGECMIPDGTCYGIWQHDHRCSNCFSKRAIVQKKTLFKTEVMGDKAYSIKTTPYLVIADDGEEKRLVIESVQIKDISKAAVNSRIHADLDVELFDYLFNQMITGVVHMDAGRNILFANRQAKDMILRGGETEEFRMRTIISNWIEGRKDIINPSLIFTQRYEYDHKDIFFDVQIIPFDNNGSTEMYIILHEHTYEEADIIARALDRDLLTELYNEAGFRLAVQRTLDQNPDKKYIHFRLDIKKFSLVNSMFGMKTGDDLLRRIAALLDKITEETGSACRFYGDQFGAFLEKDYFDFQKLESDLEDIKRDVDSVNFGLVFRVGIYEIEDNSMNLESIFDHAGLAMRSSMSRGDKIAYSVYSEEMKTQILAENRTISHFDRAVINDEFQMYLQPQTDALGNLKSAEALVRWIRAEAGIVQPEFFVSLFEKNGMIHRMDHIVWEKAAALLAEWKDGPFKDISISVNVSPVDITLMDIGDALSRLVKKYDIDPGKLNVEITETAMVDHPEEMLRTVEKLHSLGFHVEIDDFGSGYSSFKMLNDLDIDVLKIDRAFLKHTEYEEKMRIILSSIIQMTEALGITVITEGVETKEMVDYLTDMGCGLFQGYYFSKPIPVDEFMEKYRNNVL